MSRSSLCLASIESGRLEQAMAECLLALDIWSEALGPHHPDYAIALKARGWLRLKSGNEKEGCSDIEEALAIEQRSLPPDHPHIAVTLMGLGACAVAEGNDALAAQHFSRARDLREKKLGHADRRTAESRAAAEAALARVGATGPNRH
jgi:tetratricopeptide (TPR) repeat protein